jgi:undecaprenyl-diphosphatase
MTVLQVIIFAFTEGLTEFLPVSSTAHLLLLDQLWPVADRQLWAVFSVVIQLGAMLAVLGVFWHELWQAKKIWGRLLVTIIPTLILGLIFNNLIEAYLQDATKLTGWVLLGGGIFFTGLDYLWQSQITAPKIPYQKQVAATSYPRLALVGVAQALAMIPGVSRSAATLFGARALGFSQMAATKLSFILGLPTIAAASAFMVLKQVHAFALSYCPPCPCPPLPSSCTPGTNFFDADCLTCTCSACPTAHYSIFTQPLDLVLILLGSLVAFTVAAITAKFFIKILGTKPFWYFGLYRVLIGLWWLSLF